MPPTPRYRRQPSTAVRRKPQLGPLPTPLPEESRPWTEQEEAAREYDWWKFRGFRKVATPKGIISDAKEAHKDLLRDPLGFPVRFKERIEGYDFQDGPDIGEPGFTYPYRGTTVTPRMAQRDLELAQQAVARRKPKR